MVTRKLEKREWSSFLNQISKGLDSTQAEIEVASLNLGGQIQADWVPLFGIVYDSKHDIVEVAVEGLDHIIHHPIELYIEEEEGKLSSLSVIDGDGVRHLISLRQAVTLR